MRLTLYCTPSASTYACEPVACRYHNPFFPNPDRTYKSSPTRTTQTGVQRLYPPPVRSLLIRISSRSPISLRIWGFQPTVILLPSLRSVVPDQRERCHWHRHHLTGVRRVRRFHSALTRRLRRASRSGLIVPAGRTYDVEPRHCRCRRVIELMQMTGQGQRRPFCRVVFDLTCNEFGQCIADVIAWPLRMNSVSETRWK